MDYDKNVYYYPETWDLTSLGEIDRSRGSYVYDTIVFWQHKETKKIYSAQDSGCSCPIPFEDFNFLKDLTLVETLKQAKDLLDEFCGGSYSGEEVRVMHEVVELISKLHDLLP